jgi:hypothetical protein
MAFVAGDQVFLLTQKAFGAMAPLLGGGGIPLRGSVDAVASPSVRVTWQNGLTTQYLDDGAQLLPLAIVDPSTVPLLHTRVTMAGVCNNPANPGGQGASEGLVVAVFGITILGVDTDFAVVKFSAGDTAIVPVSQVS